MTAPTLNPALPAALASGGFTYDPRDDRMITVGDREGFVIAIPGTERLLRPNFTTEEFAAALADALASVDASKYGDDVMIGGWKSGHRGYMIELSNVFEVPQWMAEVIGRSRGQEAIFDLGTGRDVSLSLN